MAIMDVATTARALPRESSNLMDEIVDIILSGSIWPAIAFGVILCVLSFVPDRTRNRLFDRLIGGRRSTVKASIEPRIDAAKNVTTLDEARAWLRRYEPMIVAACGRQEWERFCRQVGEPQPRRAVDFGRSASTYLIALADRIDSGFVPQPDVATNTFDADLLSKNLADRIPNPEEGDGVRNVHIRFVSLRDKGLCDKVMLAFERAGWLASVNGGPIEQYSHDAQISGIKVSGIDEGLCATVSNAMSDSGLEGVFHEIESIPDVVQEDEEWISSRRNCLRVMVGYQNPLDFGENRGYTYPYGKTTTT